MRRRGGPGLMARLRVRRWSPGPRPPMQPIGARRTVPRKRTRRPPTIKPRCRAAQPLRRRLRPERRPAIRLLSAISYLPLHMRRPGCDDDPYGWKPRASGAGLLRRRRLRRLFGQGQELLAGAAGVRAHQLLGPLGIASAQGVQQLSWWSSCPCLAGYRRPSRVAAPSRAVQSNAVAVAIMSTSVGFPAASSTSAWKRRVRVSTSRATSSTGRPRRGTFCAPACALAIWSSCLDVARVAARRAATRRRAASMDELAKLVDRRRRHGERPPVPAQCLSGGRAYAICCGKPHHRRLRLSTPAS
jgi:hypothetical protein